MPVTSLYYILFVAAAAGLIHAGGRILRTDGARIAFSKGVLIAASFIFAAWADVRYAAVLAILCLTTWFCARSKRLCAAGIVIAIAVLAYFKYAGFFAASFARIFGSENTLRVILPVGISFYTFSAIAYLADIRRGKETPRPLWDVTLLLSYFPKLTCGPIQKIGDLLSQFAKPLSITAAGLCAGAQIFAFGMFKKVVLADRLAVFANEVFAAPAMFDSPTVFLGMIAYALQIYFDFSGYSDMAIGSAQAMGIHLPRNFNLPYCARNATELWKRWHITLSSWLQEYIYIPLGGSRRGKARTYINLILTMLIGGLWHGAQAHFLIWGLWHGLGLAAHKVWAARTNSANRPHSRAGDAASTVVTFLFTCIGWVFFRAESMADALRFLGQMLLFKPGLSHPHIWTAAALIILIIATLFAAHRSRGAIRKPGKMHFSAIEGYYPQLDLTNFRHLTLFFIFCGLILGLAFTGASPFIYGAF